MTDPAAAATAPLADANLFHALRAAAYLDAPMPLLRGLASRVAAKLSRGAQRALDTESVFLSAEEERGAASERDLGAAAGIAADGVWQVLARPETHAAAPPLDLPTELLVRVSCGSPLDIARVAAVSLLFARSCSASDSPQSLLANPAK